MLGPTLVTLEVFLRTNVQTLSWSITCFSVGSLIGVAICALTFDLGKQEVQLSFGAFLEGVAFASAPLSGNVYVFLAFIALAACGHGFVNSGKCAIPDDMYQWYELVFN